jgi:hypothetical protein
VIFGAIIYVGWKSGGAHYPICGLRIAAIDESSDQQARLAPPLIGVLMLQILARRVGHNFACRIQFILR